jgi:hypothetical protein
VSRARARRRVWGRERSRLVDQTVVEVRYARRVAGAATTAGGAPGTWLRPGSLLTLLGSPQPARPTGSLFRRLRRLKGTAAEANA